MKFNKTAVALLSAGAVIGTTAVIALQTHAQQAPSSTPQSQTQPVTQVQSQTTDKITPQDTDNIQDPGGVEKPDAPATGTAVKPDQETNDDQGSDKDTTPDNGKDDANEAPNSAD